MPDEVKSATQLQAACTEAKMASAVRRASGLGNSRKMQRVTMPSMPSLPIIRVSR